MAGPPLSFRCDLNPSELSGAGALGHCARCDRTVVDLDAVTPARRARLLGQLAPLCVRFAVLTTLASPALAQDSAPIVPGEGPLPVVDPPATVITGALDTTAIAGVIKREVNTLVEAYEARLKKRKDLAGRVEVKFTLTQGEVTTASVSRSTIDDAPFEREVVAFVEGLTFDLNGTVVVTYPFLFSPKPSGP